VSGERATGGLGRDRAADDPTDRLVRRDDGDRELGLQPFPDLGEILTRKDDLCAVSQPFGLRHR
jgi:hypothetical protein